MLPMFNIVQKQQFCIIQFDRSELLHNRNCYMSSFTIGDMSKGNLLFSQIAERGLCTN